MAETAPVALVAARHPALDRPGRRAWVFGTVLLAALGLAGEAAAAPVTVGLGLGYDVPTVPIADDLTIDRGDPLGFALTVPVLVGGLRFEPQLTYSALGQSYGTPHAGIDPCSRSLTGCNAGPGGEGARATLGLALGPAWSIGSRGRLWAGPYGARVYRFSESLRRDWSLGASLGGEFFLADRFSFGLDVRAVYTTVESGGAYTTTTTPTSTFRYETRIDYASGWTVGVDGLAAFRFYLN